MKLSNQSSLIKGSTRKCSLVALDGWKDKGLPIKWLQKLSELTQVCSGLEEKNLLQEVARDGEASNSFKTYSEKNIEQYLIVNMTYLRLVPLLEELAKKDKDGPFVISFDGPAGSGKTTLAKLLGQVVGGSLVHMDDFFLPKALRSEERLAQAGGNVHYERFREQVIDHLRLGKDFSYDRFDCKLMAYSEEIMVKMSPFIIIEGSYSRHPYFGDYSDLKVFCLVSESDQKKRIVKRNGIEMFKVFESKWIPMENKYLKTYQIQEKSDICL